MTSSLSNDQGPSTIQYQLNDAAVSLLEQNCFCQAIDTFRDTFRCFNSAASAASGALKAAHERLSSLQVFPYTPSVRYCPISIQTIDSIQNFDLLLEKLEENGKMKCFLPIRFGDHLGGVSDMTADLACAIVKYNFGIAYRAYAQALLDKRKTLASNNNCLSAARALESAETTVATMTANGQSPNVRRTLVVHMIILLGLYDLVAKPSSAEKVRNKMLAIDECLMSTTNSIRHLLCNNRANQ